MTNRKAQHGEATGPALARKLGTSDAVVIGLDAMIGAGVFAAWAPAAASAGTGLLIGLALAGLVAFANAESSAVLAARYPTSGGTYVYARERVGEWWGFAAGWGFVIGKLASISAMAMTFGAYAAPGHARLLGVMAVLVFTAVNYFGIAKTAWLARVLLTVTLLSLFTVLAAVYGGGEGDVGNLAGRTAWTTGGVFGVLQAAGFLFFAFAGYARIATMGEEVRTPERTIPRAIPLALAIVLAIYVLVVVGLLLVLGPDLLAGSNAPLAQAAEAGSLSWLSPAARIGAAVATLGAMLALVAGVGRMVMAMARNRDLPHWLGGVHPRYRVPHRAEMALAVVVCALVLTLDLRGAIGFSSFGVLVYYALTNASAYTLSSARRLRWFHAFGLVACLVLAAALPWTSVAAGVGVFAVGLVGRVAVRRRKARSDR
jgi:basic amino acid/polyamine antiporter, APA family